MRSALPTGLLKSQARTRRRGLNAIRAFLCEHELELTEGNLLAAHRVWSGLDPALGHRIAERQDEGLPITPEWLREATDEDRNTGGCSVRGLAQELEDGIDALSRATRDVRHATSSYGDELERRVDDLTASLDPDDAIAGLADFAKLMLARSRQTENELRASELETARLRRNLDQARQEADLDYLTGLPNRRAFDQALRTAHEEAVAAGRPLALAYCDIDRFKAINDTHGHEAGDRIICEVAQSLCELGGAGCYIARHGGEEFAVLMQGATPEDAYARLDRVREELARRRMINLRTDTPFGLVTFSGGIADAAIHEDPRDAVAAADAALYRAKENGRNRIVLADDPGSPEK